MEKNLSRKGKPEMTKLRKLPKPKRSYNICAPNIQNIQDDFDAFLKAVPPPTWKCLMRGDVLRCGKKNVAQVLWTRKYKHGRVVRVRKLSPWLEFLEW